MFSPVRGLTPIYLDSSHGDFVLHIYAAAAARFQIVNRTAVKVFINIDNVNEWSRAANLVDSTVFRQHVVKEA